LLFIGKSTYTFLPQFRNYYLKGAAKGGSVSLRLSNSFLFSVVVKQLKRREVAIEKALMFVAVPSIRVVGEITYKNRYHLFPQFDLK